MFNKSCQYKSFQLESGHDPTTYSVRFPRADSFPHHLFVTIAKQQSAAFAAKRVVGFGIVANRWWGHALILIEMICIDKIC